MSLKGRKAQERPRGNGGMLPEINQQRLQTTWQVDAQTAEGGLEMMSGARELPDGPPGLKAR